MNVVMLYGNLTRDPQLKHIDRGTSSTAVVTFTIATHRHFKKADGGKGEETTFTDCEAWDSGAETIAKFVHKGDPLLIERGSLRNDNYEKEGVTVYKTKVRVERFELMPRREKNGEYSATEESTQKPEPVAVGTDGNDIPF